MMKKEDLPPELQAELEALEAMGPGEATEDMPEFDFSRRDIVRGKYHGLANGGRPDTFSGHEEAGKPTVDPKTEG